MDLRVDGKVVRTATGREREQLAWQSWDVTDLVGKRAELQIVDQHSGGWGHVNVDHILLANQPARAADERPLWADFGPDFYAGVSWSDIPESDGRRIWLGWMSNWQYANEAPTFPWRSAMSIPRELSLIDTPEGIRLRQTPVRELKELRGVRQHFGGGTLSAANAWLKESGLQSGPLDLAIDLEPTADGAPELKLFACDDEQVVIRIDRNRGTVSLDRSRSGNANFHPNFPGTYTAPISPQQKRIKLHIFVDASSIELFINNGEQVLTALAFPSADCNGIEFAGPDDGSRIAAIDAWALSAQQ
jgi:fructan beta-fructosidase